MIVDEERPYFSDRADAGQRLADSLRHYGGKEPVVLAVPRGGLPVAIEIADKLGAALDLVIPRKITIPNNPEAGYGAVTEDGTIVLNEPLVKRLGLTKPQIQQQAIDVQAEIARRSAIYRNKLPSLPLEGKTVIIIDDGLASGFTMIAAVKSVERRQAAEIVVAVPVASGTAYDLVKPLVDELVCLVIARLNQFAVAGFYHHWYDLSEQEAIRYLEKWRLRHTHTEG